MFLCQLARELKQLHTESKNINKNNNNQSIGTKKVPIEEAISSQNISQINSYPNKKGKIFNIFIKGKEFPFLTFQKSGFL